MCLHADSTAFADVRLFSQKGVYAMAEHCCEISRSDTANGFYPLQKFQGAILLCKWLDRLPIAAVSENLSAICTILDWLRFVHMFNAR